jgi:hypothetical protein
MPAPRPRPRIALEPAVRVRAGRRQPPQWVEAVSLTEAGFGGWVREFEATPLFRALADEGLVRRSRWRGWIPADEYSAYLDAEVLPLVERYGLEERPGWIEEFGRASPQGIDRLAREASIPVADVRRLARYAAALLREDDDPPFAEGSGRGVSPEANPRGAARPDTSLLQQFVARHELDPDDLRAYVLGDEIPLARAARELGVPEEELLEARATATAILVLGGEADEPPSPPEGAATGEPALARLVVEHGVPCWAFDEESQYALTYRLRRGFLERLAQLAGTREEAQAFFERIHRMNQRKSLVCRLLGELLRIQWRFLATGERRHLAPLSQAALARAIEEHRSTVCRLLRGRWVESPWGPLALSELLPSRSAVLSRLFEESPDASDQRVADTLRERFGIVLSRRTVAYHRARLRSAG